MIINIGDNLIDEVNGFTGIVDGLNYPLVHVCPEGSDKGTRWINIARLKHVVVADNDQPGVDVEEEN